MADVIARYEQGEPTLYYTWTPNWISDVLAPGEDVVQIGVPHSADSKTVQPDGFDPGFAVNDIIARCKQEIRRKNRLLRDSLSLWRYQCRR